MIDRKNVANLYPLTALQEGMLYHALRHPESRAYFERLEFGLDGPLDATAYRAAWQDLTDRHDTLRTLFTVRNTPRPLQVVLRQWPVAFDWQDVSDLAPEAARARIEAWKANDLATGLPLTDSVPMRLALFRLAPDRHRVVWTFSHILLDGWCLGILQHELEHCYLARLDGRTPQLPPAPRFAAYVRWLGGRDGQTERRFWANLLDGFDTPTPVPPRLAARFADDVVALASGHDDPAQRRGEHVHPLSSQADVALATLARSLGVTANSVVQTVWGLLLGAGQGRNDAVFAATVAGRPTELPGAEATVGLFINAVPVRVRCEAGDRFGTLISRVHEQGIAARPFHATPLPEIQSAHPLRNALTDHVLVFENYPQHAAPADPRLPTVRSDDADLHEYTHYDFEAQFFPCAPVAVAGIPPAEPSRLRLRFDSRRHEAHGVARLAERFEALLLSDADLAVDDALGRCLPSWRGPRHIALAASFTAEPVAEALGAWLRQFAQPGRVELAPYNQCARALIDPHGVLARADLGVLLYHPEDALRDLQDPDAAQDGQAAHATHAGNEEHVEDDHDDERGVAARLVAYHEAVEAAFAQWRDRADAPPLVVALLPSLHAGSAPAPLAERLRTLAARWHATVRDAASPRIIALDLTDPATATGLPVDAWPDPVALRLGHVPYSEAGCAALGAALARVVLARSRAPFKVLAVDCDNTLWAGICGEAGPLGVRVDAPHQALQRFLLARQEEGFMIALASKNVADDVWAVLDQHPDMLLRRQHVAAAAINWQPKSGNLRQLAEQLNVGIDSFIFIDDNPAEIAEVAHGCPQVLAWPLPADPARLDDWLPLLWACDLPVVTDEDRERTRMMQAEASRQDMLNRTRDLDAFLAGIDLRLAIGPMAPHQLPRVAQLTQRTNQFNLSGKRRSEAEVAALAARPDTHVLVIEVEDRFGAYGLTGVVIAQATVGAMAHAPLGSPPDTLIVDTLLLSCRVLGRRVEHGVRCALARLARRLGCTRVIAPLRTTARNEPVRQFLATPPWQADTGLAGTLDGHLGDTFDTVFVVTVDEGALADVPGITLSENHLFSPPAPRKPAAPAVPEHGAVHTPDAVTPSPLPARHALAQTAPAAPPAAVPHHALPLPIAIDNEGQLAHALHYLPWLARAAGWPWRIPAALRTDAGRATVDLEQARAPQPGTEAEVAAQWAQVLQIERVPADIGFTELGGHSLHAVRAVSRLEQAFGLSLGLARFYALGTVAAIAAWLDEQPIAHGARATALPQQASLPPVADAIDYPLSHAQYRLWLLSRLGNAPSLYNQCAAWHLHGELDADALARAVHLVAARHEALRTVFPPVDGEPRQRILIDSPFALEHVDASGETPATLGTRIADSARHAFDLETGPLVRIALYQMGPHDHVLALTLHHLISDGWSFATLLADLGEAYRTGTLPPPPLPRYRDYAAWNRSDAFEQAIATDRDYWRQRFGTDHSPAIAAIPGDRPRPAVSSGRGATLRRVLHLRPDRQATLSRLLAGRDAQGTSLFHLLASTVATLIARLGETATDGGSKGGEGDEGNHGGAQRPIPVRIGTPVAGRDQAALEPVIGLFVNTLVLDTEVRLDGAFTDLLTQMRDTALGALAHQRYPFDRLVNDLAPARDAGRNPLFDVLVALQNTPRAADGLPGIEVRDLPVALGLSAFDLIFEFARLPEGLVLDLSYASDLYSATTAGRLLDRFETLLHAVLDAPTRPLAELPVMDARERALVDTFSQGPRRAPANTAESLPERFFEAARARPTQTALICDTGSLDFGTLAARATTLARQLGAAGIVPGDRVGVLLPRNAAWPVAMLATLAAGAVYLPLDPRHPAGRLRDTLGDAQPALLLTTTALAETLGDNLPCPWQALDDGGRLGDRDDGGNGGNGNDPALPPAGVPCLPRIAAHADAYLLYTSGSTGIPKGVRVDHAAFLNMIDAQIAGFGVNADDVVLQLASCAFDASLSEYFMAWLGGAPVALADERTVTDGGRLGSFIRHHRVTIATFTPSYLRHLEDEDIHALRTVILAGEAAHGRDVGRLRALDVRVFNAYGPTETAVCASFGEVGGMNRPGSVAEANAAGPHKEEQAQGPEPQAADTGVPIGRPLANLHIALRDARGQPVPLGIPGELVVFGVGVAQGYWRRPALTAARFIDDPRLGRGYRTGDRARWRDDGAIDYLGRDDDLVKLRGLRIEPGEIAARLRALPQVEQAAVTLEHGPAGDELVAWACTADQDPERLARALAADLPDYMVPTRWVFLPELPLTTSGKLDRTRLQLPDRPAQAAARAPDALERTLQTVWHALLGRQLDPLADIFLNGANSLLAMQAARRIAAAIDRPCPAILIFRHPTLRALASALRNDSAASPTPATRCRWGHPDAPTLFALPPAPGLGAVYAQWAAHLVSLASFDLHAPDVDERSLASQLDDWARALTGNGRGGPPPILFGHSGGGRLALALAARLQALGHAPAAVLLADTWHWDAADPRVATPLAEIHRRAEADDLALASASGLDAATDVVAQGRRYRQQLASLPPLVPLASPIHHFLAAVDEAQIPDGFSRDWSSLALAGYHTHPLAGGHADLLAGPHLAANAQSVGKVLSAVPLHRNTGTAIASAENA